jgi:CheY-like chemotaxis protein
MASSARRNLNILVVDDENSSMISVAFVLRRGGHAVDTALRYHIIITDHAMPDIMRRTIRLSSFSC